MEAAERAISEVRKKFEIKLKINICIIIRLYRSVSYNFGRKIVLIAVLYISSLYIYVIKYKST